MIQIPTSVPVNHMDDDVWEEVLEYMNTPKTALRLEPVCKAFFDNLHKRQRVYYWNYYQMKKKELDDRAYFHDHHIMKMPSLERLYFTEQQMDDYLTEFIDEYSKVLKSLSITFDRVVDLNLLFMNGNLFRNSTLKHFSLDTAFDEARAEFASSANYRMEMSNVIFRLDFLRSLKFWPIEYFQLKPEFPNLKKLTLNFSLRNYSRFLEFHNLFNQITELTLIWRDEILIKYFPIIFCLIRNFTVLELLQLEFDLDLNEEEEDENVDEDFVYDLVDGYLGTMNANKLAKFSITVFDLPDEIELERMSIVLTKHLLNLTILEYNIDSCMLPVAVQAPKIEKFFFKIMHASYDESEIITEFQNSATVKELCLVDMVEVDTRLLLKYVEMFPNIRKIQLSGSRQYSYNHFTDENFFQVISQWKNLQIVVFRDCFIRKPLPNVLSHFIKRAKCNPHSKFLFYNNFYFRKNCNEEIDQLLEESVQYRNLIVC